MVEHIVLFQWIDTASAPDIERAVEGLRALKGEIEGIVELSCGTNTSDRSQGYTHGLYVRFVDRASLEAYQPHPAHQEVVQKLILPLSKNTLVVDYDCR